ncbi:efflux RND transporter permease subunit [uncultured Phascolarctobacterium sp.]|mgnify:FL=1|jgi:hydrophobe/amphiphile efflux-1 (HAE1) family protein|uniref:efflux RND transporter permease subunit n=1 Tax=uncultured Phascolarctobacterium sp. TaxID=512296 RepID=UPI0025E129C2|nr:efflux RND transporter permease subunit [uncultured Phascolarctobacterium sp.]
MARFFIDRPVFAIVLAIIITLLGTIAGFSLPIAQYPNITKPRISVNTNYVGASADIVEKAVAQTIEQKVSGVENMLNMSSVSTSSGEYELNVEFNLEKNADIASVEVQNRVSQATSSLPSEVSGYGVTTAKESAETIMYFGLYSPKNTYDAMFLRTYADANFLDAVKRVKGVSTVGEYGPEYAVRIWLNPEKMAQLGVTVTDVSNAIKTQNVQAAVGSIGNRPTTAEQERTYSASAQGRLNTPEEFGNVIIRSNNGDNLKLKDIATIKEGPRNDLITSKLNGGDSVVFPVSLTSDANAIETVKNIREVLKDAETRFPDDLKLVVIQDNTQFITESLEKVAHTFFEALVLVILVVFMFLGSWRATLIPILAVPVSLVGTFASFVILGFTINTLTAFAMILAIGLVVDDAIVVVEAVEHHIQENGMSPKEATYRAMNEVSGPVVAIAFVLSAVFIPVAFTGGTVGELYKQFAITISVSMMLSAIVALSLTPALCSLLLVKKEEAPKGFIGKAVKAFDDWFARTLAKYVKNVEGCIRKSKLILTCLAIVVICIGFLAKATPTGFVPNEDQGMTAVSIALPEGASSNRTEQIMAGLAQKMRKLPGVKNVMEVSGIDILSMGQKANAGLAVVTMEDYSKRSNSVQDIIPMIFGMGAQIPDATVMAFQPPSLPGASSTGTLSLYLMNLGGEDVNTMGERANEFLAACRKRPEIGMLYTTLNTNTPMYQFEVDRDKAQSMNVPVSTVYSALQAFLGGNEINDINNFGRTWKVVMQADEKYRTGVEDMRYFFVRSNDGQSIPLNTLVKPLPKNSSVVMTRFNGASAIKISGDPASGYSSGQAMAAIEEVAKEVLPNTYTYEWTGQSLDEIEAGSRSTQIFIISLIFVFLCLAALYESWTIPLAVLLSVPSAVFGCFLVQYARGLQNDVYMQIGLITLIGLAAKNAILIVEYAKMNMEQGMDVVHAAIEAAHVRLRPILMTSFAFILGCLPLAIATGPGAGARVSMGNAVVGGMTIATLFGIFLIPVLFVVVERFFSRKKKNPDDNVTEQL